MYKKSQQKRTYYLIWCNYRAYFELLHKSRIDKYQIYIYYNTNFINKNYFFLELKLLLLSRNSIICCVSLVVSEIPIETKRDSGFV